MLQDGPDSITFKAIFELIKHTLLYAIWNGDSRTEFYTYTIANGIARLAHTHADRRILTPLEPLKHFVFDLVIISLSTAVLRSPSCHCSY